MLLTLTSALLTVLALTGYGHSRAEAWKGREIRTLGQPARTYTVASIIGLATAALVHNEAGTSAAVSAAAAAWLAVVYTSTDLATMRLPKEPAHLVAVIGGLAILLAQPSVAGLLSLGFCLLMLAVVAAFSLFTRIGLGFGDVRMIWAITLTATWWWTPNAIMIFFFGACALQLALRTGYRRTPSITLPANPVIATPATAATTSSEADPAPRRSENALPFGPALAAAYLATVIYVVMSEITPCLAWGLPLPGC